MWSYRQWKIKRILKKILVLQTNRANNQPTDSALKKEVALYFQLATLYKKMFKSAKHPFAFLQCIECYRQAANLNDPLAHYFLGHYWLDEAKFRYSLQQEGILSGIANVKQSKLVFEEAHAHLLAAEQLGHTAAKRLRGLCLINGWGVSEDKNAGFELVVASIEQEGSWDKVPRLFADLGLNKPEFFSALMQRRKGEG